MSGQKIIEGARDALAWTKATNGGRDLPTEADRVFLSRIAGNEPFAPYDLGAPLFVRARCSRLGWADQRGKSPFGRDWFITPYGRVVLETRVHERPHPAEPTLPSHDGETMS